MDKKKIEILLGKRIKQLRNQQGLTQEMVSERAVKISEKRWSDIERGRYAIGLITLINIAKGLSVPLHELFKYEVTKSKKVSSHLMKRRISKLEKQIINLDKQLRILKTSVRDLLKLTR